MRVGVLVLLLAVLAGCPPEEQAAPIVPVERPAEVVTATRTASAAVGAQEEEEEEPEVLAAGAGVNTPDQPKKGRCKALPWSSSKPCARDAFVYVVAEAPQIQNPALARDTAANRGRQLLLQLRGADEGVVEGAEVVQVGKCRRSTFALMRAPRREVGAAELPACGAEVP